jgi:hypothetical protein
MLTTDSDRTELISLRHQAYQALLAAMPAANIAAASQCSARLMAELPAPARLESRLVLVAFGGGKDSAYTLAFVRVMQLILFRVHGTTFRLRVATNRHAGMPRAVLENIAREYEALRLTADPDCELLLIDGNEVTPFDVATPQRDAVIRRNRLDILMTGHRTFADGRPTFCNACNLSVVNSFGVAASYGSGADLIITGDSPREQRQYAIWVGRLARTLGAPADVSRGKGLRGFMTKLDDISQAYSAHIHGTDAAKQIAERRVATVPERLRFFSIYADTQYAAGDHMKLLTGLLGFKFDDIAFSFTESDCGNPALMAHLRGLKCERVFERSYAEGIGEYVQFALGLMRKKDFPAELVEQMGARYRGTQAISRMRQNASDYALTTFRLTEEQLVCMAYSPFAGNGAGLADFLWREHPALAGHLDAIHLLLAHQHAEHDLDPQLAGQLECVSGLGPTQLRLLYSSPVWHAANGGGAAEVIDAVLEGDPHKAVIRTRQTKNGPHVFEQISGR